MKSISIGLVGDFDSNSYTHIALNNAIEHCRSNLNIKISSLWIPTDNIDQTVFSRNKFHGCWITPGSPYKNDEAVYALIRWARENNFPILGICGGFQYMVIEYARNVLGLHDVGHEESEPTAKQLIVKKINCSLRGLQEKVLITSKQSWLYKVLQKDSTTGHFNCSYGVNPAYQKLLDKLPLTFTAFSAGGEARALELTNHQFFNGVLFQPPLDSTPEKPNELIMDFFKTLASRL